MRLAALLLAFLAQPAAADRSLLAFMGGQGCTFSETSRDAALAAGFEATAIDTLIFSALAKGNARKERTYVVLGANICTIRPPDIQSAYSVESPEVRAITSDINAHRSEGEPGCFLDDPFTAFGILRGGAEPEDIDEYLRFLAANIIVGDLRFFDPSPLHAPVGFQVVAGTCGEVENINAIRRSHALLLSGFGDYIRFIGYMTPCNAETSNDFATRRIVVVAKDQWMARKASQKSVSGTNAWLWFEYDLIAMAAGWREGMSRTSKGKPRPPLCHYLEAQ